MSRIAPKIAPASQKSISRKSLALIVLVWFKVSQIYNFFWIFAKSISQQGKEGGVRCEKKNKPADINKYRAYLKRATERYVYMTRSVSRSPQHPRPEAKEGARFDGMGIRRNLNG